jgi:signal transduction histidine kinase
LIVAEDVSEELATKARLIQSERLAAIGRMAAHITHEVRNPLSSIGLNVEMLEEEMTNDGYGGDEARGLLRAIQREIERLTSVTEEYLRLARLPTPDLLPEYVGDILHSTAEFLRPELKAANIALTVDAPENLPMVALDDGQFRQVLINLIKNAREAMPQGGHLILSAHGERDAVAVRIADEGAGMEEAQQARIFDLFYTTKKLGSGLGLPLTQQIVIAHGGTIHCESAPNEGTVFELRFPIVQERKSNAT